jgi:hypothetical protein
MTTLIINSREKQARQFLAFAQTLPYVEVIEPKTDILKKSVAETLRKADHGEDLVVCQNADDMFGKLGI